MQLSPPVRRCTFVGAALLLVGCGSDTVAPDNNALLSSAPGNQRTRQNITCKVVRNGRQDGFHQSYGYNSGGLVNTWADGVGTLLPQYDAQGRIVRAHYLIGGIALAHMVYLYDTGGRIVRENWFVPGSDLLQDVLVNTWNSEGHLVRRESVPFAVYAEFKYDARGNAYQVDVRTTAGFLLLSNTYTFTANAHNPDITLRGLPYGPQFINYVFNPLRHTAAKAVVSDSEGNPLVLFEQDPARSVLMVGEQSFPLHQNFFDKISGTFFAHSWTYQNCPGNHFPPDNQPVPIGLGATRQAPGAMDFALRGTMKNVRQQIDALRRQYSR